MPACATHTDSSSLIKVPPLSRNGQVLHSPKPARSPCPAPPPTHPHALPLLTLPPSSPHGLGRGQSRIPPPLARPSPARPFHRTARGWGICVPAPPAIVCASLGVDGSSSTSSRAVRDASTHAAASASSNEGSEGAADGSKPTCFPVAHSWCQGGCAVDGGEAATGRCAEAAATAARAALAAA
eukprot:363042-Chlamydomonas_euryale.AAC.6